MIGLEALQQSKLKPTNCDYSFPDCKWGSIYTTWVFGWIHFVPSLQNFEMAETLGIYLSHLQVYALLFLPQFFGYC